MFTSNLLSTRREKAVSVQCLLRTILTSSLPSSQIKTKIPYFTLGKQPCRPHYSCHSSFEMADQGTDSEKTPLLEKAEPPPHAPHAPSEPSPPQYSTSAYPPPSSAAPRQPPYPPSAQPGPCPYPSQPYQPAAAEGPPAGGTRYPASAPPISMPAVSFTGFEGLGTC